VEAVQVRPPAVEATARWPPLEILDTPGTPTIGTLADLLGVPASATLKNLLVTTESGDIVAVGVPGDRDVDLDRLSQALGPVQVFEDFAGRPDLIKGYIGPQGLPADVRYLADPRIAPGTAWVTGANEVDRHARGVVCGRDFAVPDYAEVATVRAGDPCPRCGAALSLGRAIEIGHIFQLGRKYCDAFEVDVLGPDGRPARVTMGSYGSESHGRSRPWPSRPMTKGASAGPRRSPPRTCTSSRRERAVRSPRHCTWPVSSRSGGSGCSWTTVPASRRA
jgi:prolyl-tRNA synthetase